MVMPEDVALVFHRNLPVIPARLLRYYNHPAFRGGGTGNQPGLGGKATEWALGLLLISVLFVVFAFNVASDSTPARFRPYDHRQGRQESGSAGRCSVPAPNGGSRISFVLKRSDDRWQNSKK